MHFRDPSSIVNKILELLSLIVYVRPAVANGDEMG
jgi:hypothetical protein